MGKLEWVVLLLGMIICLATPAWSEGTIIESSATYPDYATDNDYFTACVLVKQANPCQEGTLEIQYTFYSYMDGFTPKTGNLQVLEQYVRDNHFLIDDVPNNKIWCARIRAIDYYNYLSYDAECTDDLDNYHSDDSNGGVNVGNIFINTTQDFESSRMFSVRVNEEMDIVVYAEGDNDIDVKFSVYNITLGSPFIEAEEMDKIEGQFRGSFEIPLSSPTGFIEIYSDDYPYGGKFITYAAVPYDAEIIINNDTYMGNTVEFELDVENYYGSLRTIESYIELPNGSTTRIYLDHVNTSAEYTIPRIPGNYSIECRINHSMREDNSVTAYFFVPEYTVDIDRGRSAYYQGDEVDVEIGLLDSENQPVEFQFKMKVIDPDGGTVNTYDEEDATLDDNYYKISFAIEDDADLGEYEIRVDAEDEYENEYEGNVTFVVNERDTSIVFRAEPENITVNIENLLEKEYTIRLYNDGEDFIEDIEIEIGDEELDDYVTFDKDNLSDGIEVDEWAEFTVKITPDEEMENKEYDSEIQVISDDVVYEIPITFVVELGAKIETESELDAVVFKDKLGQIKIEISNPGSMDAEDITAEISGDLEDYLDEAGSIDSIDAMGSDTLIITLTPISKIGLYEGTVEISTDNAGEATVDVTLEVMDDFKDDIDELESKKQDLDELYDMLSEVGVASEEAGYDLEALGENINEINELYSSGEYAQAYSLLSSALDEAENIDEVLKDLEAEVEPVSVCGDGDCKDGETEFSCPEDCAIEDDDDGPSCNFDNMCQADENCDCGDCANEDYCSSGDDDDYGNDSGSSGGGGSKTLIIFVVVILVVIVVIVATSIVPDDYNPQSGAKR